MKKITFILSMFVFAFAIQSMAQICDPPCTPDVTCIEVENPGQICPEVLPVATVDEFYDETVTVVPPAEFSGLPVIHSIRIDDVQGMPAGMEWCKSDDVFLVTEPYTRYCCQLSGTPETLGEYQLTLLITPFIDVFGVPVEQAQMTDDTSLMIIVVPPAPGADFSANITTAETGVNISFTDESSGNPTAWAWAFEGGTPATSEDQNPTAQWATEGSFDVTLVVTNDGGGNELTMTDYIIINNGVMVDQELYENIKVYPNPATSQITVEAENLESISIVDMLGKTVYTNDNPNSKEVIDISKLTKANYFITIKTVDGEITKNISIK